MVQVVVADDKPVQRWGVRSVLEQAGLTVVAEVDSLGSLRACCVGARRGMLITCDLLLHREDVLTELPTLLSGRVRHYALIFTSQSSVVTARRALDAGARGFLTTRAEAETLVHACREVVRGQYFVDSLVGVHALQRGLSAANNVSAREQDVLEGVAVGETVKQTASRMHLSIRSIETYRRGLREKLRCRDKASLLAEARIRGLLG